MKKLKLLSLLSSIIFIYLIYIFNNNHNLTYLSVGDDLALGVNSYGAVSYGYSDYFKDYLENKNMLSVYSKDLSAKNKTIKDIYNDILKDKKIIINNSKYTMKQILREADIMTISIGINDIIYEYNVTNKVLTNYQREKIINNIYIDYKDLMKEIKKYYKKKIYIIGYYSRNTDYDDLIIFFNKKLKSYANNYNDYYIDIESIGKNKDNFDSKSYYPNMNGYYRISKYIIKKYEKDLQKVE